MVTIWNGMELFYSKLINTQVGNNINAEKVMYLYKGDYG